MRLEPKPAIQATLYVAVFITLLFLLPAKVLAVVGLTIMLGCLWWLTYILLQRKGG
jgi:hypothetical protein